MMTWKCEMVIIVTRNPWVHVWKKIFVPIISLVLWLADSLMWSTLKENEMGFE